MMSSTTNDDHIRTLKEFLEDFDDTTTHCNNIKSYNVQPVTLSRSRSKTRAAAEAAISSFQKLLKSINFLSSASAPETLPRSLSKKFLTKFSRSKKKNKISNSNNGKVIIKVKDILKWKSFRDVAGQSPLPLEGNEEGPTSSGRSGSPSCSDSKGSSWDDSEFTCVVDELPRLWGKGNESDETIEEDEGKTWADDDGLVFVGLEMGTTFDTDAPLVGPKVETITNEEEKEQHSPVSVLNSPFRDENSDEELVSTFDQSLANVERTKQRLLQSIQLFESLAGVSDQYLSDDDEETTIDEEAEEEKQHEHTKEEDKSVEARSRLYLIKILSRFPKGERGLKDKEMFRRDLETQEKWNKFEEERLDVGMELEASLLHDLVDDVLVDLFN